MNEWMNQSISQSITELNILNILISVYEIQYYFTIHNE